MVVVLAGLVPMQLVGRRFLARGHAPSEARYWILRCTLANLIFTVCWTTMGPLLWVTGDNFNHTMLVLVLACTLAGDTALMSACRPFSISGAAAYGSMLVFLPLHEGGFVYDVLGVLALLFVCYMFHLSQRIHATVRDMLQLRYEKNDLIEALALSKAESDKARDRAESASRSKSEFLANMSHELRTPLNAIIGFSEMIHSGGFAAKTEEYSRLIHESGHHLLTLINDILDLYKIEAGRMTLREGALDPTVLIADCLSLMRARADAGSVTLTEHVLPEFPKIYADDRALKQVLLNLLSNAIKFTPPGGAVNVSVALDIDGACKITVSDNGVGISAEDQERVFESFGQGRHDIVIADKSTGLGLPIVKGLMEAHGGDVSLISTAGQGTSVTVTIPAGRVLRRNDFQAAS